MRERLVVQDGGTLLIRILLILFMAASVNSAEILIRAKTHWLESADTTGWTQEQYDEKERVTQKGSPIVAMPDDHTWGSAEGLPDYIIVKLPDLQKSQVIQYVQSLQDTVLNRQIKQRKFRIPEVLVDSVINYYSGVVTMTPAKLISVIKEFRQGSGWE